MAQTISLFLHSTGTTPAMWAQVPADVLGDTKKVAPTHLGYPGGPPLARGQVCHAADDAKVVLAALPPEGDVHLVAHSYGGLVAFDVMRGLGARLKSMFLYEPVMFGAIDSDPVTDAEARAEADGLRAGTPWFVDDQERGGTDPWLEVFIDYWNRPGSWARLPPHMQQLLRHVGWKMFQEVRACILDVTHFDEVPIIGIPTTIAMGERSPKASRAMARGLVAHNRERAPMRLVELAGTGHMAPVTHADKLWDAVREHQLEVSL